MLDTYYDVVIIGAGPAGLATAIALASHHSMQEKIHDNAMRIVVIDQQPCDHQRIGENVPSETLVLLNKLGLEAQFAQDGHEPCPDFSSVWGGKQADYHDLMMTPYGHSWRLNRFAFDMALVNRAQALGIELVWQTRFIKAEALREDEQASYCLTVQSESQAHHKIKAGFVVDASGSKASFAKTLNVHKKVDDKLIALVRFAQLMAPHKGKQVQIEATDRSWCYHSLLPEQKVMSMLVADLADRKGLEQAAYQGFKQHLPASLWVGDQLKEIGLIKETFHTYMITSGVLEQVEGDRWLAVGDAAASYDPIAAQGIYKGIKQGLFAAEVVFAKLNQMQPSIQYTNLIHQGYGQYLRNRAHIYQLEQRWPQSEFWLKRSQPISL